MTGPERHDESQISVVPLVAIFVTITWLVLQSPDNFDYLSRLKSTTQRKLLKASTVAQSTLHFIQPHSWSLLACRKNLTKDTQCE